MSTKQFERLIIHGLCLIFGQSKVEVFIKFIVIDRDFDSSDFATAPNVIADLDFISKPGIRLYVLLVNVAQTVKRTSTNRVSVSTVNLSFVAVGKPRLSGGAKV